MSKGAKKFRHKLRAPLSRLAFWGDALDEKARAELADKLAEHCDKFFEDDDGEAGHELLNAIARYAYMEKVKSHGLPTKTDELTDLQELFYTLNEAERRLANFPPKADAHAFTEARKAGRDWHAIMDALKADIAEARAVIGAAFARVDAEPQKTNPGKKAQYRLMLEAAAVFEEFTDYDDENEFFTDRNSFLSGVLKLAKAQPPKDISHALRDAEKTLSKNA